MSLLNGGFLPLLKEWDSVISGAPCLSTCKIYGFIYPTKLHRQSITARSVPISAFVSVDEQLRLLIMPLWRWATWRGTAQQASVKQTVHENKLWKPAAQRIAESGRQVTPPPQKNKQQKFAKCPHARGRSTLQVMDFEGAEMFIRRDEQNYGGGMRGSCRMCHVARKKCWWEPWIYVLKVGVELRRIIWGDRLGDQAIKNPNVCRRSWLPHPDAVETGQETYYGGRPPALIIDFPIFKRGRDLFVFYYYSLLLN